VEIANLPLYDQDLEAELPAAVVRFKTQIESAEAVLFVTPEFNRSFSAAIKNAIEWGSRPWGKNSWAGKPSAIVGSTLGAVGTAAAQSQLRSVVSATGAALTVQPEIYLNYGTDSSSTANSPTKDSEVCLSIGRRSCGLDCAAARLPVDV
jgi:chromate reductase